MAQLAVSGSMRPSISQQAEIWAHALLEHGFVIIPDVVDAGLVDALGADLQDRFDQTPFCEGQFYGNRTKRFGRVLAHSRYAKDFIQHALILEIVECILRPYCDVIQLNLTQALEIHPGAPAQVPHRDQDMWQGPKGGIEYLVNVMWPFTPYSRTNGATMIWPHSHTQLDEMILPDESRIDVEMKPGSVLLFLGSTLHSAGANTSAQIRRGMIVSYCLGWLKPYENQWLAYPPEIARTFPADLAALVGYRQHRPNLGNYDGQCPSVLLHDHVPEYLHAVDELRDDQAELIAQFQSGAFQQAA